MQRRCIVYYHAIMAGVLTYQEPTYSFTYDSQFLALPFAKAISNSLPLRKEPYISVQLFPCFESSLPHGSMRSKFARLHGCKEHDQLCMLSAVGQQLHGTIAFELVS